MEFKRRKKMRSRKMKNHERMSIFGSIGASLGFLINLIWADYKSALGVFVIMMFGNILIWYCGEFALGIEEDIRLSKLARKESKKE